MQLSAQRSGRADSDATRGRRISFRLIRRAAYFRSFMLSAIMIMVHSFFTLYKKYSLSWQAQLNQLTYYGNNPVAQRRV